VYRFRLLFGEGDRGIIEIGLGLFFVLDLAIIQARHMVLAALDAGSI
jgi:hypothetical protein